MGHPRWVDWDPIPHKQITVVGSHGRGIETWRGRRLHTYRVVHELMAEGRFPADRYSSSGKTCVSNRSALEVLTAKGRHAAVHAALRIPP